jgi:hypothetical protein
MRRIEAEDDLELYPTEARTLPPPEAEVGSAPPTAGSRMAIYLDRSWIVPLMVGALSAIAAHTLVRLRLVPVRAASVLMATLTVDTRPPAADLFIDGQRRGVTPLTLSLAPGAHTLTLRKAEAERIVPLTVSAGQQVAQYFELPSAEPLVSGARLSVTTDPPGARVTVDGRSRGVSPVIIADLSATEHRVTVTSAAGAAERRITLEPGVTKELVFALPRTPAAVGGWVSVASPFPVDVLENGEVVGTSGSTKIMLPAGRHEVVLRNATLGYDSPRGIDVVAGSVATINVVPPTAPLNVNAVPWAEVEIDGRSYGPTPLGNVMIAVGAHDITFRHPQFGVRSQRIVVSAQAANRVAIDFSR